MMKFDPVLVHDWFSLSAEKYPDKEALICGEERLTYGELSSRASRLAAALMAVGVKPGDRVVIFMDTCAEIVVSLYAILKAGGVFVILNGSVKEQKLRYILDNSRATLLITHVSKSGVATPALAALKAACKVVWVGPAKDMPGEIAPVSVSWADALAARSLSDETSSGGSFGGFPRRIDKDLAALIYTSGSTGEPKGVMSCHQSMISAARSIIQYIGNTEKDIVLVALPLSFDYGLYQVIMTFMFGGTVALAPSFNYPHLVLELIPKERVTGFPVVPTIVAMLLRMRDLSAYDLGSLRYITNTGAALPIEHIRRLKEMFPKVALFSMFGLTECKRVCYLPPEELSRRPASVGKAIPNCSARVVDEAGNDVAPGEVGELIVRGANVMQGYWADPELTARAFRRDGERGDTILRSGDYFKTDRDGFLYFLGRKDSMIKSKGERISPKEVENIIYGIKEVSEVVVTGAPDEILGQAVKAFVVPMPGAKVEVKDVIKHCAANMESFMVPKYVEFLDKLPKSPHGKIDMKTLNGAPAAPRARLVEVPA